MLLLSRISRFATAFLLFIGFFACLASAQELSPAQETRAKALFEELRCVVCQNQSIASSDADIAKDLRSIVRSQVAEGKSNGEVKDFLVSRYGEFVLLKPPFALHTLLLWLAPLLLLVLAGLLLWSQRGRSKSVKNSQSLSDDEWAEVEALLKSSEADQGAPTKP